MPANSGVRLSSVEVFARVRLRNSPEAPACDQRVGLRTRTKPAQTRGSCTRDARRVGPLPLSAVVNAASLPIRDAGRILVGVSPVDGDRARSARILGRRTIRASGQGQEPEKKEALACQD